MKIFRKERLPNGRRHIYLCGIKIFSYKRKPSIRYIKKLSNINYKRYDDLSLDIKRNISKIPSDIDLIVGVPRSGIIPAYMISFALNKQVCSLPEFLSGQFGENGISRQINKSKEIKKVLVVDDTVNLGTSITKVKERIATTYGNKYECVYMAVYGVNKESFKFMDIVLDFVAQPRMFQWNYLNHGFLAAAGFDIDGVLCIDPTDKENDDGKNYEYFLLNARPLYIPKVRLGAIITSRLEKYRPQTEEWLKKHNIEYGHLYMLDGVTAEEQRNQNLHAIHKAKIYKEHPELTMFIESDETQAKEIATLTKKQVFCSTNDILY